MKKGILSVLWIQIRILAIIGVLFFSSLSWAQCLEDPNDLGICDTLYVETFDCDHGYQATGGYDSVRVAIYVTHDSNTFLAWPGTPDEQWTRDSIAVFVIPLTFWHQPAGHADSVILPTWGGWNNTSVNPSSDSINRSIFRNIVDAHTGDTVYNRMLNLNWPIRIINIESHSCDTDSGYAWMAFIRPGGQGQGWWEGSRTLLATLTFHVYMSDTCDTTEIGMDSTFWPPANSLQFVRYDAIPYIPRHFLPVKDTIYTVTPTLPPTLAYISFVPDWNQPPLSGSTNYCAPVSALNILDYYDPSPTPGLVDPADAPRYPSNSNTADLIGWFMGTNGVGSPIRANNPGDPAWGTYCPDEDTGLAEYIAWNAASPFPTPGPPPIWKIGYTNAKVTLHLALDSILWQSYITEIDSGRPVKVDFKFWNPILSNFFVDTLTQDTFYVYLWGDSISYSQPPNPEEQWSPDAGHAVTGVGYIPNWNGMDWAIVHDNWPTTPENIVIPWGNLMALITVYPPKITCDPSISSINDVGNDQGRQVRLNWARSCYDASDSSVTITEYSIWRRIGEDKAGSLAHKTRLSDIGTSGKGRVYPPGDWDFIKTVPARGESTYNTVCPTLGDSTQAGGMYWSVFFVSAMTSDPLVYYDSEPDSGYSLDNIPPIGVKTLDIYPTGGQSLVLRWMVPGEYPGEQSATAYDIRYSTTSIGSDTSAWWDTATQCVGEPYPAPAGAIDSFEVILDLTQTYYFAMKLLDDRPNYSGISNIVRFESGDANGDGVINVTDVVYLINYKFLDPPGPAPIPLAAGDVNCDGTINVTDVVYLINYLFLVPPGPPPCGS